MKILIVEDDIANLEALREYLSDRFNDIRCCDAAATIEEAKAKIERERYNLVILDLMIGGKQSKEIAAYSRYLWGIKSPAIMLVSAMTGADKIADEIKADKFLPKPFDLQMFDDYIGLVKNDNKNAFMH